MRTQARLVWNEALVRHCFFCTEVSLTENNLVICCVHFSVLVLLPGLNIAELAHMDDEDADLNDQETAGSKVVLPAGVDIIKRKSVDVRKSVDARKSVDMGSKITLTRQAADTHRCGKGEFWLM